MGEGEGWRKGGVPRGIGTEGGRDADVCRVLTRVVALFDVGRCGRVQR